MEGYLTRYERKTLLHPNGSANLYIYTNTLLSLSSLLLNEHPTHPPAPGPRPRSAKRRPADRSRAARASPGVRSPPASPFAIEPSLRDGLAGGAEGRRGDDSGARVSSVAPNPPPTHRFPTRPLPHPQAPTPKPSSPPPPPPPPPPRPSAPYARGRQGRHGRGRRRRPSERSPRGPPSPRARPPSRPSSGGGHTRGRAPNLLRPRGNLLRPRANLPRPRTGARNRPPRSQR